MKKVLFFVCFCAFCLPSAAKRLGVACVFNSKSAENAQMKVELKELGSVIGWGIGLQVYITNKTDSIIFIDRANCFAIENGYSEIWFKNSATTNTTTFSTSNTVTVNAGPITVGSGSGIGTGTGTTFYEKRVIAVPPHATVPVYCFSGLSHRFDETKFDAGVKSGLYSKPEVGAFIDAETGKREAFKKNMMRHYELTNTPLKIQAMIKYSFTENFEAINSFSCEDYVTDIYIIGPMDLSNDIVGRKPLSQRRNHPGKLFYLFGTGSWSTPGD